MITELAATGQARPDVLAQAYSMRAQSKFGLGDMSSAEQDFAALLKVQPDYKFPGAVSPRLAKLFTRSKAGLSDSWR